MWTGFPHQTMRSPKESIRSIQKGFYGLLALDPVESSGEAKYAQEGSGGLLVARCNRSPLFEPGPEPLDDIAVVVDPVWTEVDPVWWTPAD